MFRYYMTSQARQALIAESNRLIAARRGAVNDIREDGHGAADGKQFEDDALDAHGFADTVPVASDSTFARFVADVQMPVAAAAAVRDQATAGPWRPPALLRPPPESGAA